VEVCFEVLNLIHYAPFQKWCNESGLHYNRLDEILKIRKQLRNACGEAGLNWSDQSGDKPMERLM
jgi:hypothetical protein